MVQWVSPWWLKFIHYPMYSLANIFQDNDVGGSHLFEIYCWWLKHLFFFAELIIIISIILTWVLLHHHLQHRLTMGLEQSLRGGQRTLRKKTTQRLIQSVPKKELRISRLCQVGATQYQI